MERRSLEGEKVTVHRVLVSSSNLDRNLASKTTREDLECFYSNPRIGGEVTSIQYEEAVNVLKAPDGEFMSHD